MAAEEKFAARGAVAIVIATAAVTVAIGITVASLGGYLVPEGGRSDAGREAAPAATEAQPAAPPAVVLVPVAPDPRVDPPARQPETSFATYEPANRDSDHDDHGDHGDRDGHNDRERGRGRHHGRGERGEHDD